MLSHHTRQRLLLGATVVALVGLITAVFADDRLYQILGFCLFAPFIVVTMASRLRDAWRAERYRRQRRMHEVTNAVQQGVLLALLAVNVFYPSVFDAFPAFLYVAFGLFFATVAVTIFVHGKTTEEIERDAEAEKARYRARIQEDQTKNVSHD